MCSVLSFPSTVWVGKLQGPRSRGAPPTLNPCGRHGGGTTASRKTVYEESSLTSWQPQGSSAFGLCLILPGQPQSLTQCDFGTGAHHFQPAQDSPIRNLWAPLVWLRLPERCTTARVSLPRPPSFPDPFTEVTSTPQSEDLLWLPLIPFFHRHSSQGASHSVWVSASQRTQRHTPLTCTWLWHEQEITLTYESTGILGCLLLQLDGVE